MIKNIVAAATLFVFISWKEPITPIPPAKINSEKPDENRLSRIVMAENLNEPMELAVLPDGGVLIVERLGDILLVEPTQSSPQKVVHVPVHTKFEDGLLGIALDPKFSENHWLYLFYSPVGQTPQQYVSRFVFDGKKIDLATEKILIKIPTQREECCHSGGSISFGKDGNLFIATGDNTSPFGSNYYAPLDEQPGRSSWDAQRTAGNTNDLRGKILRIHPEPDGTYGIPTGNLFPPGQLTRPEIYVMGCRNPIRISADARNGYLYWGDVGQNGEKDSERGPRSWDEWNQAKQAGNFGWPYFAGNNRPYAEYDFAKEKAGNFFDPQFPVNHSANNTGLTALPPAQPAFIWYNYVESDLFPHLGTGGKSPMTGPVFYADDYPDSEVKFPEYYHGKLFIYEWMRDWINVVTMKPDGSYDSIEPFMPHSQFDHPIDMEFGRNGALYVLEYGTYWFAQNANSRLTRIEFAKGNRPPVAKASANVMQAAPLTVRFSSKGSFDYDENDQLTYRWAFEANNGAGQSTEKEPTFTFKKAGVYKVALHVTDKAQKTTTQYLEIKVGNEAPKISLNWSANQSFYWGNQTNSYKVAITDKEDQFKGGVDAKRAVVLFEHIPYGEDMTIAAQNYEAAIGANRLSAGQKNINASDCKACHGLDKKSIGPAYVAIAKRYKGDPKALETLAAKVIKGGNGNWGENAMSAHPQLTLAQTTEMVTYILSLADVPVKPKSLPLAGKVTIQAATNEAKAGKYLMTVSYTDKGANGIPPTTTRKDFVLRPPILLGVSCDTSFKVAFINNNQAEQPTVQFTENESFVGFKQLDLSDIRSLSVDIVGAKVASKLMIHLDSPSGPVVGFVEINKSDSPQNYPLTLKNTEGIKNVYLVFHKTKDNLTIWNGPLLSQIKFSKLTQL